MIKWLLVLLVIVVVGALLLGRSRADKVADAPPGKRKAGRGSGPSTMLRCAHCGVHLPLDEAVQDGEARVFCSEAHRLAGPR